MNIVSCNIVTDEKLVKVSIKQYVEKYQKFNYFHAYAQINGGLQKIANITARKNSIPTWLIKLQDKKFDHYIASKNSYILMLKQDLKEAKKHVKFLDRLAAADKFEEKIFAINNVKLIEGYLVSEEMGGETLVDYCYDNYQDWLIEWLDRGDATSAERSNMWRNRFLQFATNPI